MFEAIRKSTKKRENAAKANGKGPSHCEINSYVMVLYLARRPTGVHDTHASLKTIPKLNPAELSRMKSDKEAREHHEAAMRRQAQQQQQQSSGDLARQQQQQGMGQPRISTGQIQIPVRTA